MEGPRRAGHSPTPSPPTRTTRRTWTGAPRTAKGFGCPGLSCIAVLSRGETAGTGRTVRCIERGTRGSPQVPPASNARRMEEHTMLYYAIVFLIIALIAGFFGFFGVAGLAAGIAKILFVIFIILFIASLIFGRRR